MNKEWKWDLSFLYESFDSEAFQRDLAAIPTMVEEGKALLNQEMPVVQKLEAIADHLEKMSTLIEGVMLFCELTLAVDAKNDEAAMYSDKLNVLWTEVGLLNSAATRLVGETENLDGVIASSEKLQQIGFALREMKEHCSHLLPKEIEPWMLQMQLSGGSAFSQLRDKLDSTLMVDYQGQSLPLPAVRGMAYDPDGAVRKAAYEAELAAYAKVELPMSFCMNSIKMEARTMAKAKAFDSVLDMTLAGSRMDQQTLDAMWTAIKEALPDFRRYLKAKGKLLGHENGLPFFDLFAPVGSSNQRFTVEEAKAKLVAEMGKFNPEMADFIANAFDQDWIDMYPREGKTGGAFCAGAHAHNRSLVMTNFQGSFSDVSTLAHELGHAWHNRCMAGLPAMMTETPMPLAETASIFNETMLSHQVLQSCTPEARLTLLEAGLMEATQTVVDIYSRFLFESEVIDTRADHAMTVEELKACMLRAQEASYGDGLDPKIRHPYMWACKSHYYSAGLNFYNFPYAFGLLFGKGVFARYLAAQEKGETAAFVAEYNQLLRSCGSGTIAEVAASVGIDVRSVDFWRSSLAVVKSEIDAFCAMVENN